jgi:hypothetical protein
MSQIHVLPKLITIIWNIRIARVSPQATLLHSWLTNELIFCSHVILADIAGAVIHDSIATPQFIIAWIIYKVVLACLWTLLILIKQDMMWQKMLLKYLKPSHIIVTCDSKTKTLQLWRKVEEDGVEGALFLQQLRTDKQTGNVATTENGCARTIVSRQFK